MADAIRRFRLVRVEDVSGVSGTGVVAEGVLFSDEWAAIHWLGREPMNEPTTVVWHNKGHQGIVKVHGHGGSTRIEWLDIPDPIPAADYGSAWTELRGYVAQAADDVRGFIFPSRDDDGFWNGRTWFVLRGSVRMNPDEAQEPTADKAVRLVEEFTTGLDLA